MNFKKINWPTETTLDIDPHSNQTMHDNICLDLHGNPARAKLTIFSDGNHHKALLETCKAFKEKHPDVDDIFYVTTPPSVLISIIENGMMTIGNLNLSLSPDIFISPDSIMRQLVEKKIIFDHQAFSSSKHNSILISKDNKKNITGLHDVLRDDIIIALSNPATEKASYEVYASSIENFGKGIAQSDILNKIRSRVIYSNKIHHREIPELLINNSADMSLLYHHLAKSYVDRFPDLFRLIEYNILHPDIDKKTQYHSAIINHKSEFSGLFNAFLHSEDCIDIYLKNGLCKP